VHTKGKVKFWGEVGSVPYGWNPENGRYDETGIDFTYWLPEQKQRKLIDFSESTVPF
jgi:hypothetical protein